MVLKVLNDIIIEILKEKVNAFTRVELVELLKQKGYNYTKSQIIYILNSKEIKSKLKYDLNTQEYSLNDNEKNYEINDTKTKLIQEEIKLDYNQPKNGWDSYEITLALELYFDNNRGPIHKKNKKIIELSGLLNVYSLSKTKVYNTNFRSPSSVALKLSNFLAIDSNYVGKGMSSYSKLDFELFNYYKDRKNELNEKVNEIKQLVITKTINLTPNNGTGIASHINNALKKVKETETYNHIRENRKEVEGLSIPERCKNVITSIGSLKDAYNHFVKYNNFYRVKNCGKMTNDLLADFFKYTYNSNFNNIIDSDKIVEIANPMENISNETIFFKNINLSTLNERALNILNTFDNFSNVLNYYFENKNFKSVRNCGSKTANEIENFIETYLSNKKDSVEIKIENPIKNINYWIYEKLRQQDNFKNTLIYLEEYYFGKFSINIYENLKIFNGNLNEVYLALDFEKIDNKYKKTIELFSIAYKRCLDLNHINILTINPIPEIQDRSKIPILISFLNTSIINKNNSIKEYFTLLKIFFSEEQIISILLTVKINLSNEIPVLNFKNEIESFSNSINSLSQYLHKLNHIFLNESNSITFYEIQQTLLNLSLENSLKLITLIDNRQIVDIIHLIVCNNIKHELHRKLIIKIFFDSHFENESLDAIAKEVNVNVVRERIRQIKHKYSSHNILKIFNYINHLDLFNSVLNEDKLKYIMPFNSNHINGQYFNLESLSKLKVYLPNNFIDFQELIFEMKLDNLTINTKKQILINSNIISKDDLIKNLNSFNTDNSASFLEHLSNLPNFNEIVDLNEFSELLTKKQSFQNRGNKLDKEFIIANEVRKFLKISGKPTKTENILNFLISENNKIDRLSLLKILNSKKEIFTIFGQGNWALISWRELGMLEGDLIDIVRNLINDSENPLHISEIFYYLNEFCPTSIRSILTNLRVTEKYKFKFFNCSFIGLEEKKYPNYYYNLPLVVGFHFNQSEIDKLNLSTWDDILNYYEQEFKYPKIHVEHLLMNNVDL